MALAAIRGHRTKQLLDGAVSVFEGVGLAEGATNEAQVDLLFRQIGQLKVENDFWHESSATEPGGTARDGRAPEPGAADIPAMPVAGIAPHVGQGQGSPLYRGASCTT